MMGAETHNPKTVARVTGAAWLLTILIGILGAIFISHGIDINLSADVKTTAENMLNAEFRLRAKAYLSLIILGLELFIALGLFLLLKPFGPLLSAWSLLISIGAAILTLMGAVSAMNVAELVSHPDYDQLTTESQRLMLAGLQATTDYTSFHLSLIPATFAKAVFFYLFLKSGLIPKLLAGWGVFASLFVVSMIVARDFIPVLGHNGITAAFMLSNMIALIATGIYLSLWGVRSIDGAS